MSNATRPTTVARHRPRAVAATAGVLAFLGVSAVAGGASMAGGVGAPPRDWLQGIPVIDSWVVPGLVLGVGFGLGSLATAYGLVRKPRVSWLRPIERLVRHHWSWPATIALGLGQVGWIGLELAFLPQPSMLQAVYGTVGVVLILLPLHPSVRGYLAVRAPRA